jgi:outer membrane protein assembly factor BamB
MRIIAIVQGLVLTACWFAAQGFTALGQAADWPQWRGPTRDNHAPADAAAPLEWDDTHGTDWVVEVPGRGHSSPVVVGQRIYLTTGDEQAQTQSLLIFDLETGRQLAETVAHRGGLPDKLHPKNTHASPTVASDGRQIFAVFNNSQAVWVTAFDLEGKLLWQERLGGFDPQRYAYGFGSSPVISGGLLFVAAEYDGADSGIYALDLASHKLRWKAPRTKSLSYSTPIPAGTSAGSPLLISGNQRLTAYDPQTGKLLWETKGSTYATCGTMVWDLERGLAFASGGYPETFTLAVRLDGDHEIVWSNSVKCYEQSMLCVDGYLYAAADNGVCYCWRCEDGQQMWRERLGGKFSSSPLLVDGRIYVTNEQGTTFVVAATPERCDLLATNQLGTDAFATPAPVNGRLIHRFARGDDEQRQEYLAAIGP